MYPVDRPSLYTSSRDLLRFLQPISDRPGFVTAITPLATPMIVDLTKSEDVELGTPRMTA